MLELNTGGQKAEVSDRVRLRRLSESGSSFARLAARPASRVVLVFVVQCDSSIETSVRVQPSLCYSSARPACRTVVAVFALDLFWPCSPCSTTTSGCTPCARARHRGLHNYVRCTVLRTPTLRDPPVDHSLACQPASQPAASSLRLDCPRQPGRYTHFYPIHPGPLPGRTRSAPTRRTPLFSPASQSQSPHPVLINRTHTPLEEGWEHLQRATVPLRSTIPSAREERRLSVRRSKSSFRNRPSERVADVRRS
jgi:hypothetical protein